MFFHRFFDIFDRLGQEKSTEIAANIETDEKTEKYPKKVEKVTCPFSLLGGQMTLNSSKK